ncbi:MAG: toll/interleukin-1 receptor domain-containing protein [Candidatus Cryptobacteroides sp.]
MRHIVGTSDSLYQALFVFKNLDYGYLCLFLQKSDTSRAMTDIRKYKYDVFISYSSTDRKVAEGVCGYLEANSLRCFIDYRDIPHGAWWARVLPDAIRSSAVMVAVFSQNYNKSVQVDRELSIADKSRMPILPFRLSDTPFEASKSYYFESLNWIDAFPEPEKVFGTLLTDVQTILKDGSAFEKRQRQLQPLQLPTEVCELTAYGDEADDLYSNDLEDGKDALRHMEYGDAMSFLLEPALAGYSDARTHLRWLLKASFIRLAKESFWRRVSQAADEEDNGFAQCMMSRYHGFIEIDHTLAYEYATRSARQGNMFGRMELAMLYSFGAGVERDSERFLAETTLLARKKFAPAMWFLAREYIFGFNIRKNPRRGLRLLEEGVVAGYPECMCELGVQLTRGDICTRDTSRGLRLMHEAMEAGYPSALNALAKYYIDCSDTPEKGFEYLDEGIDEDHNNPECISTLANCYEHRYRNGENIEWALVKKWRMRAAELGDRHAIDKVAEALFAEGNYAEAWMWAELSALLGGNSGEYLLGCMCLDGNAPDGHTRQECIEHLKNALFFGGEGSARSALLLYRIYAPDDFIRSFPDDGGFPPISTQGIEKDEQQALAVLKRGAGYDNPDCCYLYGCALTDTSRPYSNEIEGAACLREALAKQKYSAAVRLAELYRKGIGVLPDEAKAEEYISLYRRSMDCECSSKF